MPMQIDKNDPVSVETVNRKLESFVEVVLEKLVTLQESNKKLTKRVAALEKERAARG